MAENRRTEETKGEILQQSYPCSDSLNPSIAASKPLSLKYRHWQLISVWEETCKLSYEVLLPTHTDQNRNPGSPGFTDKEKRSYVLHF